MEGVFSHPPVVNTITSYLDPLSLARLKTAYPRLGRPGSGMEPFDNAVRNAVYRALSRFFGQTAQGAFAANTILRAIEQPNSIYAITGSFLLNAMRDEQDEWECGDLDIIVAHNHVIGGPWGELASELSVCFEYFIKSKHDGNTRYIRVPEHSNYPSKTKVDYSDMSYAHRNLKGVATYLCAGRKLQFLFVESIPKACVYVDSFDLPFCRNFFGFGNAVYVADKASVLTGRCEIDLVDAYASRFFENDMISDIGALMRYHLPHAYMRLSKYLERGFVIHHSDGDAMRTFYQTHGDSVVDQWHAFWFTRVAECGHIIPGIPVTRPKCACHEHKRHRV